MSLYGYIILDHYHAPRNNTKLPEPTAQVHVDNPLCGDAFDMEVVVKDGIVRDVGFTGQGCAISIASASMLSEEIKGKKVTEILPLQKEFVIGLLNIELSPNRLKCALLPWEGIQKMVQSSLKK